MEKITTKIAGNKLLPTELKEQNIIIHPGTECERSGVITAQMYQEIMMEMCGRVDERPKNDFVTIEAIKNYIEKLPPEGPINKKIPE
jgi:hypothetical protein